MSLRERLSRFVPSRTTLVNLLLGQLLSVLVSGTGISSSLLAAHNVNLSSTQSFLNYFLLFAAFFGPWLNRVRCSGFKDVLRDRWLMYICLAVCDVEANFLVVLAYQYTSLSSVMLLDCFSIPCVIVLSWFLLKRKVSWWQLLGVALCVGGVVTLVLTDFFGKSFNQGSASNPLMGDFLCLAAAVLYAVSNVGQEATVTQGSKLEFLALLGMFASPLSLGQSAGIEHERWSSTEWTPLVIGCMIAFAVCMWCVYSLVPLMLERSGATFLNLSLLTSDVFAIVAGIFLFGFVPSLFYILAAALIVGGLIVFNVSNEEKTVTMTDLENQ